MDPLAEALAALERGELVVFPTETVWGVGGRLDREGVPARLRRAKGREPDRPFQVLLADASSIDEVGIADGRVRALTSALMPGPLTVVVRARDGLPDLGSEGTVGVRVPDHPLAAGLIRTAGALVASSANRSGAPTPDTLEGVREALGAAVAVYLGGEPPPAGLASTVVDLTGAEPVILREGAIPRDVVLGAMSC